MDEMMLTQIVGQIVMMFLTGIAGWLGGKIKGAKTEREKSKQEAVEERDRSRAVQRLLLYHRIHQLFDEYVIKGESITSAEKHEVEELYEYYTSFGGNGEGRRMYQEIMNLRTT